MRKMKGVLRSKTTFALATWVAYTSAFTPLYSVVGPMVTALAGLPVMVTAGLFGTRAGLLASLLGLLLDGLLITLMGEPGWDAMVRTGLPGSVLLVLMGAVVGRLRDLGEQVKRELAERKQAEEELGRSPEAKDRGQRMLLALSQAAQAVQRARTPDEVYRTIGGGVAGLGYDTVVFTLSDDRTHLAISHITFERAPLRMAEKLTGLSAQDYRFALVPGGFFERVIAEGEAGFTKWTAEHIAEALPRPLRPLAGQLAALLDLEQSIVAPLRTNGETRGLLTVTGAGLSEADVPAMTAFANQTAIALHNARLYEGAEKELAERKRAEKALRERTRELSERVKELNCLYGISSLAGRQGISLEEILQGVVDLIPPAWQHPEITCARIILEGQEYRTKNFREAIWRQASDIIVYGERIGAVEVCYLEERPERDEGPFLEEERGLLNAIAERLGSIAERVRAEREIEERRVYLEEVLKAAPDAIVTLDACHRVVEWNPGAERLFGYSREEVIGQDVDRLVTNPDTFEEAVGFTQMATGGKALPPVETVRCRRDGSPADVIVAGSPILVGDELIGVVVVYSDITERKRAEEALRDEKALMDALMDNIPDSIYFKDRQSRLTRISREMMRNLNLDEMSQAVGKTDIDLFGEEFGRQTLADDQRVMATGEPIIGLIESRHLEDGQINWTSTTKVPLRDAGGEIVGLVGMTREINELMRAQEALAHERDLLQALMDNIPDTIYFKDAASRFTRINRAQAQVLGVSDAEEAVGKTDFDFSDEELARDAYADEQEIVRSGQPLIGKVEKARIGGGETRWFSATKVPIVDREGRVSGLVGVSRDITQRVWMEEQLRHYAAELEQANEEVKRFAYIVSHDLRAPLINLKGFAAELRSALEGVDSAMEAALPHLDEEQRRDVTFALREDVPEALGFMDSSVTRMDRFINALLKLSRLGRRELHPEAIDMEALVQATLETLAHPLEEHQVKVSVAPLPQVVADRTSMEQIVGNILGNAVKYLDPSRPGEIEITAERGDDETTFHIRDNGRGIAEEDMDKVFAPFRRAGRQDVPGEGMGLAYVQALVRRHGGRIWCESELGVGTAFSFTIPLTV